MTRKRPISDNIFISSCRSRRSTGNVFLLQKLMGHNDVRTLGRYQYPSIAHIGAIVNKRNELRHDLRYGAVVGA